MQEKVTQMIAEEESSRGLLSQEAWRITQIPTLDGTSTMPFFCIALEGVLK
jgi:hypothetical protein